MVNNFTNSQTTVVKPFITKYNDIPVILKELSMELSCFNDVPKDIKRIVSGLNMIKANNSISNSMYIRLSNSRISITCLSGDTISFRYVRDNYNKTSGVVEGYQFRYILKQLEKSNKEYSNMTLNLEV